MSILIDRKTIQKFDVPGPRYTSYPTAPVWSDDVPQEAYIERLQQFGRSSKTLSLYIHIPFCRTMCRFCACSVILRPPDEKYGDEYLYHLFTEIDLVRKYIGHNKPVRQFHWGGGTPTFLSEGQIRRLYQHVDERFDIDLESEVAIEIDPRTIDTSKIETLRSLGFNRVSMGVQDFNPRVQEAVNRIQPFEVVEKYNNICRRLKFSSVNFDLIYGLPYQTRESFESTVERVIALRPDRIALYSFAFVPWLKKHQTKIPPESLPTADQKVDIFLRAREQLISAGYQAIAMDHFALTSDELSRSFNQGKLYRNFMGYTVKPADEYIGVGVSSIGFLENAFFQNHKILKNYYEALKNHQLPVERGMVLSQDDQVRQYVITQLMCQFELNYMELENRFGVIFGEYFKEEQGHLQNCQQDALIELTNRGIKVTELGKIFIRNVCMGFDIYLRNRTSNARFSRTV